MERSFNFGWTPTQMTPTGKPIIDETTLSKIKNPFSKQCLRLLDLTKKLGMISEGVNAYLKLCTRSKRIHHHCSVGCATHRCSHKNPNLAQVPSDEAFRALFSSTPGFYMVGADLAGIELRMLAHYLARYDGGKYADIILNGDIHAENAKKVGVSRKQIKTISYAFLYGAGNQKLGTSFDASLGEEAAKRKGQEIRKAYVDAIEGLSDLLKAVKLAAERGYVRAIDGRQMIHSHNKLPKDTYQLAFVHDELQFETKEEHVNDLKFHLEYSAATAGEYYKLRIPIAAESKSGLNWAEVH